MKTIKLFDVKIEKIFLERHPNKKKIFNSLRC